MSRSDRLQRLAFFVLTLACMSVARPRAQSADDPAAAAAPPAVASNVACASSGERQHCAANTSAGVVLLLSKGSGSCLLGKTWGYDDTGVWVSNGCVAEFGFGTPVAADSAEPAPAPDYAPIETWSQFEPGKGFLVGRTEFGEVSISAYALVRYINQLPPNQSYTDHLGNTHDIDTRNDIYSHRIMVFLKGWLGLPKLRYQIILWTVNTTDQKAIFGNIGYQFTRRLSVYGGLNGLPGTRST